MYMVDSLWGDARGLAKTWLDIGITGLMLPAKLSIATSPATMSNCLNLCRLSWSGSGK